MNRQDNLVFDLGMHKGQDTDFYLRKGYQVVAFEASPELASYCRNRFREAICSGQLRILEGAVAPPSFGDHVTLFTNPESIWNTINSDWADQRGATGVIKVPRVDIGDAIRRYGMPHYMKIDVEGVDTYVLDALASFSIRPAHISMESEKRNFDDLVHEIALLKALGYSRFRAVQQAWNHRFALKTRTLNGNMLEYRFEHGASGPFGEDLRSPWLNEAEVLDRYKQIFRTYRLFGDESAFVKLPGSRIALGLASRIIGRRICGWYDTHASE